MKNLPKRGLFYFFIFLVLGGFVLIFLFYNGESDEISEVVALVGEKEIKITDIEKYQREVSRDHFDKNLSTSEIWEEALRKAIRLELFFAYFDSQEMTVSQNDYKEALQSIINREVGLENKDDFFQIMEMRGFSSEEIEREIMISLKHKKLKQEEGKKIIVTKEDILEEYEIYKKEMDELTGGTFFLTTTKETIDLFEDILEQRIRERRAAEIVNEKIQSFEGVIGVTVF